MARILVVDDESLIKTAIRQHLEGLDHEVREAETVEGALEKMRGEPADVVILDYKLPDGTGLTVLQEITENWPDTPVIMVTAFSTVENAVEAMKQGAFTYLNKPFDMEELGVNVEKAVETCRLRRRIRNIVARERREKGFGKIIGKSESVRRLKELARRVASSPSATVLLLGESGTGKDLLARAIHAESPVAEGPFMNVTCSALPESLIESTLFGHEAGAFTDAKKQKKGLLEMASGGSVYLDEIGEMPLGVQAKLLRFLEEKAFKRVGGTKDIRVTVRIIAATNRDLEEMVRDGSFREDLFYRLSVLPLKLPPLRERKEDIPALVEHFVHQFAHEMGDVNVTVEEEAMEALTSYSWPGNVRELRNAVERAMVLSQDGTIEKQDLFMNEGPGAARRTGVTDFILPPEGVDMGELEADFIRQALELTDGNQVQAAKKLGLTRDQLRYRMEKIGLLPKRKRS